MASELFVSPTSRCSTKVLSSFAPKAARPAACDDAVERAKRLAAGKSWASCSVCATCSAIDDLRRSRLDARTRSSSGESRSGPVVARNSAKSDVGERSSVLRGLTGARGSKRRDGTGGTSLDPSAELFRPLTDLVLALRE